MNKNLLAIALFPVDVNGSITDPFESEREVDIITDSSAYRSTNEIKIKVSFKNDLLRDIRIVNDNCKTPVFIVEKKKEKTWDRVYISDNFGLPIHSSSETLLSSNQTFNVQIYICSDDIQDENIDGEYRLRFNLRDKESNNRLPEKHLYSNVFRVTNEYEL